VIRADGVVDRWDPENKDSEDQVHSQTMTFLLSDVLGLIARLLDVTHGMFLKKKK
jgi:hypothetical protein